MVWQTGPFLKDRLLVSVCEILQTSSKPNQFTYRLVSISGNSCHSSLGLNLFVRLQWCTDFVLPFAP